MSARHQPPRRPSLLSRPAAIEQRLPPPISPALIAIFQPPAPSLHHTPQAFRERPYPNPDVEWLAIQDWIRFVAVTGSVRHRR